MNSHNPIQMHYQLVYNPTWCFPFISLLIPFTQTSIMPLSYTQYSGIQFVLADSCRHTYADNTVVLARKRKRNNACSSALCYCAISSHLCFYLQCLFIAWTVQATLTFCFHSSLFPTSLVPMPFWHYIYFNMLALHYVHKNFSLLPLVFRLCLSNNYVTFVPVNVPLTDVE